MNTFKGLALRNIILTVNIVVSLAGGALDETINAVLYRNLDMGIRLVGAKEQSFVALLVLMEQVLVCLAIYLYERPIRKLISGMTQGRTDDDGLRQLAKRRLLNQPFFVALFNLLGWLMMAAIIIGLLLAEGLTWSRLRPPLGDAFRISLLIITISFFSIQFCVQNLLVPRLFPEGQLHNVPGAWPVKLWLRLGLVVLAASLIPLGLIGELAYRSSISTLPIGHLLDQIIDGLLLLVPLFMVIGLFVGLIFAVNISRSLNNLAKVLRQVSKGRFDVAAVVNSNDEIGYVGDSVNEMITGLKERELIKDAFGKYVADDVRDEVLSGRIPLDGERRRVTVLFADLRNFTPMTEANDPKLVVRVMNRYFEEMEKAVDEAGGLVLQYLGDEIYAVFGAPVDRPDHAGRAFRAGLAMKAGLERLNRGLAADGLPSLAHGIGIHTGEVVAANIGSPNRLSYLLVGDTVNLAARLQALNKGLGTEMLISGETYDNLSPDDLALAEIRELEPTMVKGKSRPVRLHSVG